jgi:Xaa-Pro dipeptidase
MVQLSPLPLLFPAEEFRARLSALREVMASRNIDLLIINQHEHLDYYAGYAPTAAMYQAILVPLDGEPVAIIRELDTSIFTEASWLTDYVAFSDSEDPIEVMSKTIMGRGHGTSSLGIEQDSYFLTLNRAAALKNSLPEATFVDFSDTMWEMRLIKSPLELTHLQFAAEICDRATLAGFDAAQAGVNERTVLVAIIAEALLNGADNSQLAQLVSGPRSASLHGTLGHRRLADGDIVHAEPVPHFRGYTARMMRPKSIGIPTDEQMKTAETMIRIQDEQFRAMKPGVIAGEVDGILREGMLAAGLRDEYTNVTGYTLGLKHPPRTSDFTRIFLPNSEWKLEHNQVFHMYTGAGGMAFSETVVVTPEGGKRLTKMERKLFY